MRSLRLDIPDVAYGVPPLPAAARSFIGDTARHPNVTPVDIGTIQALRPSMESMFRHAVNLVDLRFPALEDFPGILHGATFRLWSLTTTGMAFGVLHQWENSVAPARDSNCYSMYSPVEKLRSLRILDLDLKGIWCSAKSLHTTFCQYHITHLTLRGTADRTLADELLPLMAERLVSFKLVLAARDQEFCPWTDIWPTQILGKAELPFLKHFELDESAIFRFALAASIAASVHPLR
ncbi:hypothetical protein BD311DRAFT_762490 [Dichomitus squalens]|uniref:F-box domain-containing protein n=1 Tax=Dichomitus squalens TaxID=114155 RepID=A0A4Q9PK03_9APHY|nr:hypothetical protein BD311DRAFT_762490 [Dichomitus squalens]TBU54416.1 hypothetical protein BD310DRAFT_935914 [Dichomitus squalens]